MGGLFFSDSAMSNHTLIGFEVSTVAALKVYAKHLRIPAKIIFSGVMPLRTFFRMYM